MKEEIGPYEDKVRASGIPIHILPMHNNVIWFFQFYRFLRNNGPFEIAHCHHDPIFLGPLLVNPRLANIPVAFYKTCRAFDGWGLSGLSLQGS